jgi:hypothetical protein
MSTDTISSKAPVRRDQAHSIQRLPSIVSVVLTVAAQRRMRGQITTLEFTAQVERLAREELDPRGLSVLVRDLPCGTTRFIIKTTATGEVWDMIEIVPDGVSSESSASNHHLHS